MGSPRERCRRSVALALAGVPFSHRASSRPAGGKIVDEIIYKAALTEAALYQFLGSIWQRLVSLRITVVLARIALLRQLYTLAKQSLGRGYFRSI